MKPLRAFVTPTLWLVLFGASSAWAQGTSEPAPPPPGSTSAPDSSPTGTEPGAAPSPDAPPGFAAPLSESLQGEAKAAYDSARLLFQSGDLQTAYLKFEESHRLSQDPRLLWNMAACQRGLRKYARVDRLIRRYLDDAGERLSDEDRAEARRSLDALAPLITPLTVRTNVEGATVLLDGEPIGKTPFAEPVLTEVGPHVLVAELEGYTAAKQELNVARDRANIVVLELRAIPKVGRLAVAAPEGATIRVDGKLVGTGSFDGELPPGTHRVLVEAQGFQPRSTEVVVNAGETRSLDLALEPLPDDGLPAWVWIGGGTLITAGLVVGGIFLFQPADPILPAGNFDPGNVVVYPSSMRGPLSFSF